MSGRITYRDTKPFCVPASLDELAGPSTGIVHLPVRLSWAPGDGSFSLDDDGERTTVYQCVIGEAAWKTNDATSTVTSSATCGQHCALTWRSQPHGKTASRHCVGGTNGSLCTRDAAPANRMRTRGPRRCGFALAGSGAIREHGMTQRPTNDIDLFTVMQASTRFPHAVDSLIEHLTADNYDVTVERVSPSFAQLSVTPPHGVPLSVDLAIDWRAHTPVRLDVGPRS